LHLVGSLSSPYIHEAQSQEPKIFVTVAPHFDVVVGLAWSNDPESFAGSSDATGMISCARQVKGDDLDKKGYPGPPGWGLGVRLTLSPRKTCIC